MYCPSFPEAPTMHTLISSSPSVGRHPNWPAFQARHEEENAGVTEARNADPQSSGVSEGLPAFVSRFTILRADIDRSARHEHARLARAFRACDAHVAADERLE